MNTGIIYHILLTHAAGQPTISGEFSANGQLYSSLPNVFAGPITNFLIDTVSISSYEQRRRVSLLAHGTVDNFVVTASAAADPKFFRRFHKCNLAGAIHQPKQLALHACNVRRICNSWSNISTATSGNGDEFIFAGQQSAA